MIEFLPQVVTVHITFPLFSDPLVDLFQPLPVPFYPSLPTRTEQEVVNFRGALNNVRCLICSFAPDSLFLRTDRSDYLQNPKFFPLNASAAIVDKTWSHV